jgi:polyisoprenoid-binding protein YceI
MKKIFILVPFLAIAFLQFSFNSFQNLKEVLYKPNCQAVIVKEGVNKDDREYVLESKESKINWQGYYVLGGGHQGTLRFESGSIVLTKDDKITQSHFKIAMNSLENTDLQPKDGKADLEKHLKSGDFFSTDKFPNAYFKLKKVQHFAKFNPISTSEQISITGELTIKGLTRPITFMAELKKGEQNIVKIQGEVKIDRSNWGINYKSPSLLDSVKDGIISNEIKIKLDLTFRPADGC